MTSKHVAFYITGGIAAYKAAYCVREFVKHGYEVRCAMTKNAAEFVSPLTFETLCKSKVVSDLFDQNNDSPVAHIDLADWTDLAVVVPATADVIGKMANGIADAIRSYAMTITDRAMFSRAVSGMRKKTLIINLPGSPKAVTEALEYILPKLPHGLDVLRGNVQECGRK